MMMKITHLPFDLITDIFSRLPAKTVVCLKIICKSWYTLINDNNFVNYHLERSLATKTNLHYVVSTPRLYLQEYAHLPKPHEQNCSVLFSADLYSFDNPIELSHPFKNCKTPVSIVGSCRGLLLLWVSYGYLLLYNPTTQTYNVLPLLPVYKSAKEYFRYDFGFGYDSVSRDYKCVRIMQCLFKDSGYFTCEVMVYSLRTNRWKKVSDVPCYFSTQCFDSGVLLHEMYHWTGTNSDDKMCEFIVGFNLRDEMFTRVPLPNLPQNLPNLQNLHFEVGMLDDCLCVLANRYPECDLWIMKEYGVAGSWTRMFTFGTRMSMHLTRPLGYSTDKKRLLLKTSLFLHCFDLETMKYTELVFQDWNAGLDPHVYVENLLMLDYAEFIDEIHARQKRGKRKNRRSRRRKTKN